MSLLLRERVLDCFKVVLDRERRCSVGFAESLGNSLTFVTRCQKPWQIIPLTSHLTVRARIALAAFPIKRSESSSPAARKSFGYFMDHRTEQLDALKYFLARFSVSAHLRDDGLAAVSDGSRVIAAYSCRHCPEISDANLLSPSDGREICVD